MINDKIYAFIVFPLCSPPTSQESYQHPPPVSGPPPVSMHNMPPTSGPPPSGPPPHSMPPSSAGGKCNHILVNEGGGERAVYVLLIMDLRRSQTGESLL